MRDCAHRVPTDRQTFSALDKVSRECILQNAEPHATLRVGTPLYACKNVEGEGFFKKNEHLFIWLRWVLVSACGIPCLCRSMQDLWVQSENSKLRHGGSLIFIVVCVI